jgi:hypothetical protein
MKRNVIETVLLKPMKGHHKLSEDVLLPAEGRTTDGIMTVLWAG